MGQRLGHRPGLDGVRAVAIGGVMGLHAIARVFPAGLFGVDIFFVLSAFLITTLIIEELDDRHGQFSFRSFYARRALRLGPALVLWLALIAAPTAVAIHESDRIALSTFVALFYLGDFTPALGWHMGDAYQHVWSLAIEEQFYVLWPAAIVLLYGRRIPANVMSGAVGAAVVIAFASMHAFGTNYFLPTGHLVALTAGCVAAYLFKRGHRRRLETIIRHQVLGASLIVALCLAFITYRSANDNLGFVVQAAICAGTAALILHLCWNEHPGSIAWRLMTLPPVLWVGRRSYGLYLYHRTLTALIPALIPGITLKFAAPLVLALAFVVAETSFRLVERPVSRRGRARLHQLRYPKVRPAEFTLPIPTIPSDSS